MQCICNDKTHAACQATDQCFQKLWLFDCLSQTQLEELKRIGRKRLIQPGEAVFLQGNPARDIFLIKRGRIRLSKVDEDGTEFTLDFRKAGDVIGENVFSEDAEYPVSASAMEETLTCGLNRNDFDRIVHEHPDIGLSVIRSMSSKITSMTDRIHSMSGHTLEIRLYRVISQIAKEHGTRTPDGFVLSFPLTHEELGFLVGAHRVSVTKAMQGLLASGKIEKDGKNLVLTST